MTNVLAVTVVFCLVCSHWSRLPVMWCNDSKTCSNLMRKSTGIKNIITSLPLWIKLMQADSFEHWLVMYFLKYCMYFGSF